jgi:hypothetical protein
LHFSFDSKCSVHYYIAENFENYYNFKMAVRSKDIINSCSQDFKIYSCIGNHMEFAAVATAFFDS